MAMGDFGLRRGGNRQIGEVAGLGLKNALRGGDDFPD